MGLLFKTVDDQIKELNDTVWCRLGPSKIHGIGVFAIRDIPKGQCLYVYGFDRAHRPCYDIPKERLNEIHPAVYGLISDRHMWLGHFTNPSNDSELVIYMNHSDHPNCGISHAIKDIKAGEEITEEYSGSAIFRLKTENKL